MSMSKPATRGTIEIGIPIVMVALLGALLLHWGWGRLPEWIAYGLAILVGSFGLTGLALFGKPGGMGSNASFSRRRGDGDDT